MYTQPLLFIPPDIEAGLLAGIFRITNGSIVRWTENGRIYKHLQHVDLPSPESAKALVARRLADGSTKSNALVIAGAGAVLVGGAYVAHYVKNKRAAARTIAAQDIPQCVTTFEASLRAYMGAGRTGALDGIILDQLIDDLDAVKAFTEEGSELLISLDNLLPLFDLVVDHTGRLATAYGVDLGEVDEFDSKGGVVLSLRRHLVAQKTILAEAV